MHPGELKDIVCSPAGTSIEAVRVLEDNGFRSAVIRAATTERMIEICFIFVIKETKTYKISMNFKFPLDKQCELVYTNHISS